MELERYCISVSRGFLPSADPILCLPGPAFRAWEEIGSRLSELLRNKQLRQKVERLSVFRTNELNNEAEWWRAYVLLTFVSHGYIWCEGEEGVAHELPKVLAVPWCVVANHVDMPPVITHAAAVLHNWCRRDPSKGVNRGNLNSLFSFTDTKDEEWFYIETVLVEVAAVESIREIPAILQHCDVQNSTGLIESLCHVEKSIKAMQEAVYQMRDKCSPNVFYNKIRCYHAGWKNNDVLPNGLLYQGVNDLPVQYSGGNAGQSSTLATLDTLLGVEHAGNVLDFFMTQRHHMIRQHRLFLEDLKARLDLRQYVKFSSNDKLVSTYNNAVQALVELRNEHIKLVTLYIVLQKSKGTGQARLQAKGTGGTAFMQLLKTARDNTKLAKL